MITLPELPATIAKLPKDERGYPVPWFVSWVGDKPDFRMIDGRKWSKAIRENCCWICGEALNPKRQVFVIGPMCAINKTTSEPPSHEECAIFAAQACPFLSMPNAKRREANIPAGACGPPGMHLDRNPGVACLWYCKGFSIFDDGRGGALIRLPNPAMVRWYAEGRKATRAEILESIESGMPILEKVAAQQSPKALQELFAAKESALKFVPAT